MGMAFMNVDDTEEVEDFVRWPDGSFAGVPVRRQGAHVRTVDQ